MKFKKTLKVIGILLLGALGAMLFNVFLLPYLLTNPYFERFQFVKDFKSGKIIVNPKEEIRIQENTALEEAILRVGKSIVAIQGTNAKGSSYLGSGLIATSDGLALTLASLTPAGGSLSVFINGEKVNFKVQKIDSKNNLALIKIDKSSLPTVGFSDFDKIKLGQRVFLTGALLPKSGSFLANEGIIRSFDQNIIKTNISEKSTVNGSSLFNIAGELVGLSYVESDGTVSAVPANKIKEFLGF